MMEVFKRFLKKVFISDFLLCCYCILGLLMGIPTICFLVGLLIAPFFGIVDFDKIIGIGAVFLLFFLFIAYIVLSIIEKWDEAKEEIAREKKLREEFEARENFLDEKTSTTAEKE